ncbi:recombinase family protein [Lysinibacillus sp. 3P01SB]|uniref:recombinase family protein n=1 Tax=Lysinibacillus sp. 3P01SB TaxID=3132284 RepID=UPI0039A66B72
MSEVMGYVRVSDRDQNPDRQYKKMLELNIPERFIFIDKASGKDFNRPQYITMKNMLRAGDLIYIDALDRLGRNYDEIIKEWKYITRNIKADIILIENATLFDSRKFKGMNDIGKLMEDQFLSLLAYVAEQERNKILQRQKEGIAAAKAKGKHLGRPQFNLDNLSPTQLQNLSANYGIWKSKKITGVEFAKILQLKKSTFYKIINQYELKRDISLMHF